MSSRGIQEDRRLSSELVPRARELARLAAALGLGFNIDAEESDRLALSLKVIDRVLDDPALDGWDGFGVVVQAYGPRAADTIAWLAAKAESLDRKLMIRLVKGAYWDTEIKRAQVMGLDGFPVLTQKPASDVNYIACARQLLTAPRPAFTRNPPPITPYSRGRACINGRQHGRRPRPIMKIHNGSAPGMGEGVLHDIRLRAEGTRLPAFAGGGNKDFAGLPCNRRAC